MSLVTVCGKLCHSSDLIVFKVQQPTPLAESSAVDMTSSWLFLFTNVCMDWQSGNHLSYLSRPPDRLTVKFDACDQLFHHAPIHCWLLGISCCCSMYLEHLPQHITSTSSLSIFGAPMQLTFSLSFLILL